MATKQIQALRVDSELPPDVAIITFTDQSTREFTMQELLETFGDAFDLLNRIINNRRVADCLATTDRKLWTECTAFLGTPDD